MAALSIEQENYVRMSLLLTGVSPRAVRKLFDKEFAPACLNNTIRSEYIKIRSLLEKKHINHEQWKLLQGGPLDSKSFDVPLMICLLRNLTNIKGPRTGYDVLPQPSDQRAGADLARLKYYRNFMAHITDDKIDNSYFSTAWDDICNAILRLGGPSLRPECDRLKYGPLDQSNVEILKEVRLSKLELKEAREDIDDLRDEIQELTEENNVLWNTSNDYDLTQLNMLKKKAYKKKDFIETESYRKIINAIQNHQCIIVTGPPGCGKLINALNAAFSIADLGLDSTYLISSINKYLNLCEKPYNICSLHKYKGVKKVFVFENIFGKCMFNERNFISWKENLSTIKLSIRTSHDILIFKCRRDIYESFLKCKLGIAVYECPVMYNETETLQICKTLLKSEIKLPSDHELLALMPVLCSLQDRELFLKDIDRMSSVSQFIDTFIQRIKDKSMWGYRAVVLLCLMNNNLDKTILRKTTHSHDDLLRKVFLETGERVSSIKEKITRGLLSLSFIEETETGFSFIYESLFDHVAIYVVGINETHLVIDCSASSFLRDRVVLQPGLMIDEKKLTYLRLCVNIDNAWKENYHTRILRDLKYGHLWNVLSSYHSRLPELKIIQEWFEQRGGNAKDAVEKSTGRYIATYFGCTELVKILIKFDKSAINAKESEYKTPLYYACTMGYFDIVKLLIENGAIIDSPGLTCSPYSLRSTYISPLCSACANGHFEVVALLLENIHLEHWEYMYDAYPLHAACESGNNQIVKLLINQSADVNKTSDICSVTPLHIAAFNGYKDIVDNLLSNNASVNIKDNTNVTPLLMAANNGHVEVVDILLKHFATVKSFDRDVPMPIFAAARNGFAEVVELLLLHNANVNTTFECKTVLGIACLELHEDVVALLLKYGANTEYCEQRGRFSALHLVCQSRLLKDKKNIVHLLLKKNVDINQLDLDGNTPLYYALVDFDFEIAELLIQNNATVNNLSDWELHCLSEAVECVQQPVVKFLLANLKITCKSTIDACINSYPRSPRNAKEQCRHDDDKTYFVDRFKILLANNADLNHCNKDGFSLLTLACAVGNDVCIPILLNHGVIVNALDKNGRTPLYTGCLHNHINVVSCLLENKADINHPCSDGSTALQANIFQICCTSRKFIQEIMLNKLLSCGADVNMFDKDIKKNALHMLCETNNRTCVGILLNYHPDLCLRMQNGFTPLHAACFKGHTDIVGCLLKYLTDKHGVQNSCSNTQPQTEENFIKNKDLLSTSISTNYLINETDLEGHTPLHIACIHRRLDIMELLLRSGASIDIQDNNNCTPLYLACENENEKGVKLLLENKANVNLASCNGCTPLHSACRKNNLKIVCFLLNSGADKYIKDIHGLTPFDLSKDCIIRESLTCTCAKLNRIILDMLQLDGYRAFECQKHESHCMWLVR